MAKIQIDSETVRQINAVVGPVELVDAEGQTVGVMKRPPTAEEIQRAKNRASQGGETLSWDQLMIKVKEATK